MRHRVLYAGERSTNMNRKREVELSKINRSDRCSHPRYADIVDHAIKSSEGLYGMLDDRFDIDLSGDIGTYELGSGTQRAYELFAPVTAASSDYHSRSFRYKELGYSRTNAACAAAHHRD